MLTATPPSNGAPADSAAMPTGAPLGVSLAAPGLRGMRSAARPEGRGDADRGPLQALNPTSGGDSRRTSPLSNLGLAVCVSFRQFFGALVETQQFPPDRVRARTTTKVRDAAGLHQPSFLAWKAPSG